VEAANVPRNGHAPCVASPDRADMLPALNNNSNSFTACVGMDSRAELKITSMVPAIGEKINIKNRDDRCINPQALCQEKTSKCNQLGSPALAAPHRRQIKTGSNPTVIPPEGNQQIIMAPWFRNHLDHHCFNHGNGRRVKSIPKPEFRPRVVITLEKITRSEHPSECGCQRFSAVRAQRFSRAKG
jgi:hypothetical protein